MYETIEDARSALTEAKMDVEADMGADALEAGYSDVVHAVADMCSPEVAAQLCRMEGVTR